MNTKERFINYLKEKGIGQTAFEAKAGLSRGSLAQKTGLTVSSLEKIAKSCNDLNLDWLITGCGEMLKSDIPSGQTVIPVIKTKPRVPATAAAGSLSGDTVSVTLRECEQLPVISQMPSYDYTIIVKGDSMMPKYESGDEIACRRIDQHRFIQWGKVHVLDTSQGIIVKKIYEEGDSIRCVSINPAYPPFLVPKEDVYSLSLVVGSLSITEM